MMNAEAKEPAEAPVRFGARAANITGSVTGLESQGSQRNGSASESRAEEDPEHGGKVRREQPVDEFRGPRRLRAREGEARTGELRQRERAANSEPALRENLGSEWRGAARARVRENLGKRCRGSARRELELQYEKTSVQNERLGNPSRSRASIKHDWALLIAGRAAGTAAARWSRVGGKSKARWRVDDRKATQKAKSSGTRNDKVKRVTDLDVRNRLF